MKVFFFRHGQTDWNATHRLQGGNPEIDINSAGVRQAEDAALGLVRAGLSFDRIYVSPYRRAAHTAEILCAHIGGTPVEDQRIREISFGDYDGTPYLDGGYIDDNIRAAFENPADYEPHGGETYAEVLSRVRDFLDGELKPLEGRCSRVLVVTHLGIMHTVATIVQGLDLSRFWKGGGGNCSMDIIDIQGGRFSMERRGVKV